MSSEYLNEILKTNNDRKLSKVTAIIACISMAVTYVGLLYAPRFLLRLQPPTSLKEFMLRRFASAVVSSLLAVFLSAYLLLYQVADSQKRNLTSLMGAYGIRWDHLWQAVAFPVSLTTLMYLGHLVSMTSDYIKEWNKSGCQCDTGGIGLLKDAFKSCQSTALAAGSDVTAWRNYVVAPLTEELVFRACMVPLLLCGGFQPYSVIFFCPTFFGLAHMNHFWELYFQQNYNISRAALVVGIQLVYTTIFGWYASFLFIRTGHLCSPIVAHVFCNIMGLPNFSYIKRGKATAAVYVAGVTAFFLMLMAATNPRIYVNDVSNCNCWSGFCKDIG